jgi:hypothetical protein
MRLCSFLDYLHGKEGQQLMMKGGLWSPRNDTGSLDQKFEKVYLDSRYSLDELEKKLVEWENLMRQLFYSKKIDVRSDDGTSPGATIVGSSEASPDSPSLTLLTPISKQLMAK